jgi:hypothetical protein
LQPELHKAGGLQNFTGSMERNRRGADVREIIADPKARELITFPNCERATRQIRTAIFPAQPFLCKSRRFPSAAVRYPKIRYHL